MKSSTTCLVFFLLFLGFLAPCTAITSTQGVPLNLTSSDISSLISLHNSVRSAANLTGSGKQLLPAPASALPSITWDSALSNVWGSSYSNNCVFAHTDSSYRSTATGKTQYVGENLAWYSGYASLTAQFALWYSEHTDYIFHPLASADFAQGVPQTGHYTQLIWSATTTIGCSYVNCTGTTLGGFLLACNYYNGGNYLSQTPYSCNGAVQSCSSLGLACGASYTDYCKPVSDGYGSSTCSCASTGTSPSSSPAVAATLSASPTKTGTPTRSVSRSRSNSASPSRKSATSTASASRTASRSVTSSPGASFVAPSKTSAASFSPTSLPSASRSSAASSSPAACYTCAKYGNPTCGVYSNNCGGSINCGNCTGSTVCSLGNCVSAGCNPPCSNSQVCSSSRCVCAPGYTTTPLTGDCVNTPPLSNAFPFTLWDNPTPNTWVAQTGNPVELDAVDSSSVYRSFKWSNSDVYCSISNTTVTAQFYTGTNAAILGIGVRHGQGAGRVNDSSEWRLEISGGSAPQYSPHEYLTYYGGLNDWGLIGTGPWTTGWNTVALGTIQTSDGNTMHTITVNGVWLNYGSYGFQSAYLPNVGGVFFSASGLVRMRNLMISTTSTLVVSVSGCMSNADWQAFVASVLGTSSVSISNSNGASCGSSKKRQAGAESTLITFSIGDGINGESSTSLASKFVNMAQSNDEAFTSQGVNVESVVVQNTVDAATLPGSVITAPAAIAPVTTVAGTAGGLSTGAIVGIVVGSVAGLVIVAALAILIVVGAVILVRKMRSSKIREDVREPSPVIDAESPAVPSSPKSPRGGVDIYPDDKKKFRSITGRSPEVQGFVQKSKE